MIIIYQHYTNIHSLSSFLAEKAVLNLTFSPHSLYICVVTGPVADSSLSLCHFGLLSESSSVTIISYYASIQCMAAAAGGRPDRRREGVIPPRHRRRLRLLPPRRSRIRLLHSQIHLRPWPVSFHFSQFFYYFSLQSNSSFSLS